MILFYPLRFQFLVEIVTGVCKMYSCLIQCICLLSEILLLAVCYRLEEGGILTDCSIQTQEPDETLDFDFSGADVLNKIIMKVRKDNISYTKSFLKQLTGPFFVQ